MANKGPSQPVAREKFSSGLGVFLASLGSAIGLGNIWRFPYLVGENGGGAFLFIYLGCTLFVGIPVMVCEFYIGRRARANAVGAFEKLKPGTPWKLAGLNGVLATYLLMFFYSSVSGWTYSYIFKAARGRFAGATPESVDRIYRATVSGIQEPLLWQAAAILAVSVVLLLGVRKGIERITKALMPVFLVLLLACCVRSLLLPGAVKGLRFLFAVNTAGITTNTFLIAVGLSFFKLSLGLGTMITYGSYFTDDSRITANAIRVVACDTFVSILGGIAIFPAVFSFGMEPAQGRGLLFATIPLVFSRLPLGNLLLVLFFLLSAIAATSAMISLAEVPIAYLSEEKGLSRKTAVAVNFLIVMALGSLATLSASDSALLANLRILGYRFFDLFDYISSNILLPLGGLCIALFTGYATRKRAFLYELSNHGALRNRAVTSRLFFITRYVTPLLLGIVFLHLAGIL